MKAIRQLDTEQSCKVNEGSGKLSEPPLKLRRSSAPCGSVTPLDFRVRRRERFPAGGELRLGVLERYGSAIGLDPSSGRLS